MTKMTPRENKWLEDYRRREAAKTVRMQRRALWFWGALFTTLGALGIALFLVSILLGIVNNRRILADKRPWGDL